MEGNEEFEQSFYRYTDHYIEQLKDTEQDGRYKFPNQDLAVKELSDHILYGEPSEGAYTLDKLLQLINQAPEDINEDSKEDAFIRLGAIKAVMRAYSENQKTHNVATDKIIDTMVTRRLKLDKETYYTMSLEDPFPYRNTEV